MKTFIDLLAGIGGFRLGLESRGLSCVFASEKSRFAGKTYRANFEGKLYGDIKKIDAAKIPPHDILCAGFPNQMLSLASKRKGMNEDKEQLLNEVIRIAKHHQPEMLLLENLPHNLPHDEDDEEHTNLKMYNLMSDTGYKLFGFAANPIDFGSVQNKEFIFYVGMKKDSKYKQSLLSVKRGSSIGEASILLIDSLESEVDEKYTLPDAVWNYLQQRDVRRGFTVFSRFSPYIGGVGSHILIDQGYDKNPRMLTPRECARVQGFPDSFKLPCRDKELYGQIVGAVVPEIIGRIFDCIALKNSEPVHFYNDNCLED